MSGEQQKKGPGEAQPQQHSEPQAPKKGKTHTPVPGCCHAVDCKAPDKRFNFCDEHYEQFKFGLIKKTGEPVPDYEKKFEHYMAYKARQGVRKVA